MTPEQRAALEKRLALLEAQVASRNAPKPAPQQAPPQQAQTQQPSAQQIFNQPADLAISAMGEIGQGNFGVGGARLARAGINFIPSVIGGASQGIRELGQASGVPIVNEMAGGLANVIDIPGALISGPTNLLDRGFSAIGNRLDKSMGLEQAGQSPYAKEMNQLGRETLPYAVGTGLGIAGKGAASGVAKSVAERPTRLFKKEVSRVAPPTAQELGYKQSLERSIPYLEQEIKRTPIDKKQPESQFQQATDIVTRAKERLWDETLGPQIERHGDVKFSGDVLAKSVENNISFYLKEAEPAKQKAMQEYADRFRGKTYTLAEGQELIRGLNAEMGKGAGASKTPETRAAILETDPLTAAREGAADALRDVMVRTLSERGEVGVKAFRQDYGALRQVQNALRRNVNKAELSGNKAFGDLLRRHSGTISIGLIGEMVGHQLGLPIGTFGPALIALKETAGYRAQPNVTIARAFKRLEKSKFPEKPTVEPYIDLLGPISPRKQLGQGAIPLGGGYKDTFTIRTGPISAVPDVSLSKPKQLYRGPIRPEPSLNPEVSPQGTFNINTGRFEVPKRGYDPSDARFGTRIGDLVWDAKKRMYVEKKK